MIFGGIVFLVDWDAIRSSLESTWYYVGLGGSVLVLYRFALLVWYYYGISRFGTLAGEAAEDDGGGELERDVVKDKKYFDSQAEARINKYHKLYNFTITTGIVGYWILVSVTGGPFSSPLATIAIASMFLGQVRADTLTSLWILFAGALLAIGLSFLVSDGVITFGFTPLKPIAFSAGSFALPNLVVAFITTWVNSKTFFGRVDVAPG